MAEDFAEHGKAAIVQTREKHPDRYIRAIACLMPKVFEAMDPAKVDDDDVLTVIKAKLAARAAGTQGGSQDGTPP